MSSKLCRCRYQIHGLNSYSKRSKNYKNPNAWRTTPLWGRGEELNTFEHPRTERSKLELSKCEVKRTQCMNFLLWGGRKRERPEPYRLHIYHYRPLIKGIYLEKISPAKEDLRAPLIANRHMTSTKTYTVVGSVHDNAELASMLRRKGATRKFRSLPPQTRLSIRRGLKRSCWVDLQL